MKNIGKRLSQINRRQFVCGVAILSLLPPHLALGAIKPTAKSVLLVVDVQNCFLPGGTLAVKGGHEIIPLINELGNKFENVILTQDWHTPNHASFASSHPGKNAFETIELSLEKF